MSKTMKYMAFALSAFALAACSQETSDDAGTASPDEETSQDATQATAQSGETKLLTIERTDTIPDDLGDMATLSNAEFVTGIGGDFVTADVSYSGGCEDHEFEALWDGSWMESNPPGARVYITHDANGDTCKADITHKIQINLEGLGDGEGSYWVELVGPSNTTDRVDVALD